MRTFDDFLYVCNTKVFLIAIISLLTTFLCGHFGLTGDMPTSLIGIAVVFPIVFSINNSVFDGCFMFAKTHCDK